MKTARAWHGIRTRRTHAGSDPDQPGRGIVLPASWDEQAAMALAALAPGSGAADLRVVSELWIVRLSAGDDAIAEALRQLLIGRKGAASARSWTSGGGEGFVLNLAAFVEPGLGLDTEALSEAVFVTQALGPLDPCGLDGMLAALGLDYDSPAARDFAREVFAKLPGRLEVVVPGPVEALLGAETGGIAPAFSPVGADGRMTRTALLRLAARGISPEAALAATLSGAPLMRPADAAAHAAMHDALAPLCAAMPPRPVVTHAVEAQTPALPARRQLPARRTGYTQRATVGGHRLYVSTGEYPDGALGEITIGLPKESPAFRGLMESLTASVSLGLQHGVPLAAYVDAFAMTRFGPSGAVEGDDAVSRATSLLDYVARHLAACYLPGQHVLPAAEDPTDASPALPLDLPEATPRDRRRNLRVVGE